MGDTGMLDLESSKTLNLCNIVLFGLTISVLILFMGLMGFLFYIMTEFTTSFMIIVSSITVFVEFVLYWTLFCLLIAIIYKKKAFWINLGRKSDRFWETNRKYPRSFITGDGRKHWKEEEDEIIVDNFSDADAEV